MKKDEIILVKEIFNLVLKIFGGDEGLIELREFCSNKEDIKGTMEDFEKKDMAKFFKEYPFMKIFSYGFNYFLQQYYNSEMLCAGWCGCASPESLLRCLKLIENYEKNR